MGLGELGGGTGTASLAPPASRHPQILAAPPPALTNKKLSPDIATHPIVTPGWNQWQEGQFYNKSTFLYLAFPSRTALTDTLHVPCALLCSYCCVVPSSDHVLPCGVATPCPTGLPHPLLSMGAPWSPVLAPKGRATLSAEASVLLDPRDRTVASAVVIVTDVATWPDGDTWRQR